MTLVKKLINYLIIRCNIHQRNHQQDTLNIHKSNSILSTPVPNRKKSYLNIKDKVSIIETGSLIGTFTLGTL